MPDCKATTMTCPLIAVAAEAALGNPSLSSVWRICLCRFEDSTTSWSTIPRVPIRWNQRGNSWGSVSSPTPAAARYCSAGHPRPPAPTMMTEDCLILICPGSRTVFKITALVEQREQHAPCNPKPSRIICLPYLWYSLSDKLEAMDGIK